MVAYVKLFSNINFFLIDIKGGRYGPKIQTDGNLYSDVVSFIVFDIDIAGQHLTRENMIDICKKLNLPLVPIVFKGNALDAYNFIKKHPVSTINSNHEMEGIVLELPFDIYDKNGERIKCKCKWKDVKKINNINDILQ